MDEEYYNWIHSPNPASLFAYDDGWKAFVGGLCLEDNPYNQCPEDEASKEEWDRGFMSASCYDPLDE